MPRNEIAPRHRQVLESLLHDIGSGRFRPGQKLPSESALVERFSTSRITIGRALRELKQRGLLEGKAGSGNYVKDPPALRGGLVFGLLIPNLGESEIFEPICRGMVSAPEAAGHALLWGNVPRRTDTLELQAIDLCQQFIQRSVDGVFFAPLELTADKDKVNHAICEDLDRAQIPVVLLDRCIEPFPRHGRYDVVGIDNRRAGFLATGHLLTNGFTDAAFLALAGAAPTVAARMAGFREAVWSHGLTLNANRIQTVELDSAASLALAVQAAQSSSFVCANDRLAGRLMQLCQERGQRVPEDVRVVGIDDVEYAQLLSVPLTTVHQPCRAIGEAAISAMVSRRLNPSLAARDILLDVHLVIRRSTGVLSS